MVEVTDKKGDKWKVIWTDPAVDGLSKIVEYISNDSERYAARVAKGIYDAVGSLSIFPLRGRVVPEFRRENFRELIYQSYRIIYKVEVNRIAILSIVHSSRDLARLARRESWDVG